MKIETKKIYEINGKEFRDKRDAEKYLKRIKLQEIYPLSNTKARKVQNFIEELLRW